MDYSASTSWNGLHWEDARSIIKEILDLGFQRVELNPRLDDKLLQDILAMKKAGEVRISSLHNFCPAPPGIPRAENGAGSDFASLDESARKVAVEQTLITFDWAAKFEAEAVVVHIGHVEMNARYHEIRKLRAEGDPEAQRLLDEDMAIRAERLAPHLEAAVKTVREIAAHAGRGGPKLGLECRMLHHEIPTVDELQVLLDEIPLECGGYWHDFGHGEFRSFCGLEPHRQWLEKYGDRVLGMHIHNMTASGSDHRPLTEGIIDFPSLLPLISGEPIPVFEINQSAKPEDVRKSREIFKPLWEKSREIRSQKAE